MLVLANIVVAFVAFLHLGFLVLDWTGFDVFSQLNSQLN